MRSGWWIGVTAGVALGLGTVATVDVATQPASAATAGTVTIAQFKQVQKVSIAAVKRTNADHKKLNRVAAQLPLWAVSSGAPGSNLLRGDGVVLSQRSRLEPGAPLDTAHSGSWAATRLSFL